MVSVVHRSLCGGIHTLDDSIFCFPCPCEVDSLLEANGVAQLQNCSSLWLHYAENACSAICGWKCSGICFLVSVELENAAKWEKSSQISIRHLIQYSWLFFFSFLKTTRTSLFASLQGKFILTPQNTRMSMPKNGSFLFAHFQCTVYICEWALNMHAL